MLEGYETDLFKFHNDDDVEYKVFKLTRKIEVNHLSQRSLNSNIIEIMQKANNAQELKYLLFIIQTFPKTKVIESLVFDIKKKLTEYMSKI